MSCRPWDEFSGCNQRFSKKYYLPRCLVDVSKKPQMHQITTISLFLFMLLREKRDVHPRRKTARVFQRRTTILKGKLERRRRSNISQTCIIMYKRLIRNWMHLSTNKFYLPKKMCCSLICIIFFVCIELGLSIVTYCCVPCYCSSCDEILK